MIIGSLFVVLYKMDFPLKVHESHRGWDFLYHWMQNKWTRHHNQTKLQQDEEANNALWACNTNPYTGTGSGNVQFQSSKIYLLIVYPPITLWKYNP